MTGGLVLNFISIGFMNKFLFVFAIAATLRLLVALFFLPKIKETKKVKSLPHLMNTFTHPFRYIHLESSNLHINNRAEIRKI